MGWSPAAQPSRWPTISASAHGRSRCTAPVCWRDSGPTLLPKRSSWPCWRGCRQPILRPTPLIASGVPALRAGCRNRRSILSRRNARAILPAYSHTDNLVSPVVRNENGRSVPAAILLEFLGNNNGMRRGVIGRRKNRSRFVRIPAESGLAIIRSERRALYRRPGSQRTRAACALADRSEFDVRQGSDQPVASFSVDGRDPEAAVILEQLLLGIMVVAVTLLLLPFLLVMAGVGAAKLLWFVGSAAGLGGLPFLVR